MLPASWSDACSHSPSQMSERTMQTRLSVTRFNYISTHSGNIALERVAILPMWKSFRCSFGLITISVDNTRAVVSAFAAPCCVRCPIVASTGQIAVLHLLKLSITENDCDEITVKTEMKLWLKLVLQNTFLIFLYNIHYYYYYCQFLQRHFYNRVANQLRIWVTTLILDLDTCSCLRHQRSLKMSSKYDASVWDFADKWAQKRWRGLCRTGVQFGEEVLQLKSW